MPATSTAIIRVLASCRIAAPSAKLRIRAILAADSNVRDLEDNSGARDAGAAINALELAEGADDDLVVLPLLAGAAARRAVLDRGKDYQICALPAAF